MNTNRNIGANKWIVKIKKAIRDYSCSFVADILFLSAVVHGIKQKTVQ